MASISDRIKGFFDMLLEDVEVDRVIEYVVREVHNGRRLSEVVDDPYVRNRLNDEKRAEVFQNAEVVEAIEQEIRSSLDPADFGLSS